VGPGRRSTKPWVTTRSTEPLGLEPLSHISGDPSRASKWWAGTTRLPNVMRLHYHA
jgi:hypothetical protein